MDIVAHRLHAMRKALRIGDDVATRITAHLPAIVDVYVFIPGIFHAGSHHGVGHAPDHVFADVAGKLVPGIPAHRRSQGKVLGRAVVFLRNETGKQQENDSDCDQDLPARLHGSVLSENAEIYTRSVRWANQGRLPTFSSKNLAISSSASLVSGNWK